MDFKDIILQALDWLCLCQDAVMMGVFEHSNEAMGAIESRYFLYFHRDHKILRKVPAL
jgi:hypothetical protein